MDNEQHWLKDLCKNKMYYINENITVNKAYQSLPFLRSTLQFSCENDTCHFHDEKTVKMEFTATNSALLHMLR
jgi:aspartate carbamoyltransferase regulatory subunit